MWRRAPLTVIRDRSDRPAGDARQPHACTIRRSAVSGLRRELLHPRRLPLLQFLGCQILLVRGDRPVISLWIDDGSGAVSPELILQPSHGPLSHLRSGRYGAVVQRVAVLDVHPKRDG